MEIDLLLCKLEIPVYLGYLLYHIFPMASSSSSSSVTIRMKFDVFLSFRGEDTRNTFTDHLHAALDKKGFDTFRDEEKLLRGTEISSELLDAIEESWIAIVVLSKGYAELTWCLKELTKIMDCMEEKEQTVLPVFYNVDPSDVRKQTGDFKKAFDEHEEKFKGDKDLVEKWRAAFTKISTLSGWHLQDKRSEAKMINDIIANISERKYKALSTNITRGLFGIDAHLKKIHDYLEIETKDVRFIGIHGMGGIGKTTIAEVLYESLSFKYEGSSFLANVREVSGRQGLAPLQEKFLSKVLSEKNLNICNKYNGKLLASRRLHKRKILLVLDDVDELKQLEMLAENCDWFGPGSRVIITTRYEHLLIKHGVSRRYKVKGLNDNDALQLFHLKAFKQAQPTDEHYELSRDVIRYAKGLPLVLEVLGSHLCDKIIDQWKDFLKRLREFPPKKILDVIQISYDGLEDDEKEIFLDIACFFRGQEKNRVIDILEKCGRFSKIGIQVLVDRSLIKSSESKRLEMHDLIQEMGWNIVRRQHPNEPGKWSRLWLYEDIHYVLTNNKGSEAIEGIVVDVPYSKEITNLNGESFLGMDNLKLLNVSGLYFSEGLKYLSSKLRILEWHRYSLESLPSSFQANQLVELKMHNSKMKYLWKGKMKLETLKIMELCHSNNLIELPDLVGIENLELLDLEGCTKLPKVHESVGILAKLSHLNLRNCQNLVSLPRSVSGMKSLITLNLRGCSKLQKLPSDVGAMERLLELDVGETAITEWPSSIVGLRNLIKINLSGIKQWSWWMSIRKRKMELPPLENFQNLKKLKLNDLNLETCPDSLGFLCLLECLELKGNNFVSLPTSINQLSNLRVIRLQRCERLESLSNLPLDMIDSYIDAGECTSLETLGCPYVSNIGRGDRAIRRFQNHMKLLENKYNISIPTSHCYQNCMKLSEDQSGTYNCIKMWLQQWLQENMTAFLDRMNKRGCYPASVSFKIAVPGSEIPQWIDIRKDGHSFITKLPHQEFIGIIFCAIVQSNEALGKATGPSFSFSLAIESCGVTQYLLHFNIDTRCRHLFLVYTSVNYKDIRDKASCQEMYAQLTCQVRDEAYTVEKCGMRLVYREDLEKMDEVSNNIGRLYEVAECPGDKIFVSYAFPRHPSY